MYALIQAMRAIRNNWIASVATITTTTLSLTILSGFSLVSLNLNSALVALQGELEMAVYLEGNADIRSFLLDQVGTSGRRSPEVYFIDKEVALLEMLADLPSLQQGRGPGRQSPARHARAEASRSLPRRSS